MKTTITLTSIAIAIIALKLTGLVSWSWWAATSSIWLPIVVIIAVGYGLWGLVWLRDFWK